MTDHAEGAGDSGFTPDEQAAWDAYESGADAPAPSAPEAAGGPGAPEATAAAPEGPAAAAAAPGEPVAAPGEVVDPDDEGSDNAEANKGRFVRHGAFHKERERRKAVEHELNELREKFTRGDERMRLLSEAMQRAPQAAQAAQQAPAQPETPPDPNEDIFGYAKYLEQQIASIREGQSKVTEAQAKADQDRRAADEERVVIANYQHDISRVMQADPTFGDAYRYLVEGRVTELKLYGLDHNAAVKQANDDELALVRSAMQSGRSPAELMSQLAKSRGFVAKAPAPAAPAAPPAETAAQKAERVAAGAAGPGRSLSGAAGGPAGDVTIEMLASMSEADFDKFAAANPKKLAALMGAV